MSIGRTLSMAAPDFPPKAVRALVYDIASLLKDRKETISVAETVRTTILPSRSVTRGFETSICKNCHNRNVNRLLVESSQLRY